VILYLATGIGNIPTSSTR